MSLPLAPFPVLSLLTILFAPVLYRVVSQIVAKKLRASLTILDETPLLSDVREEGKKIRGTAVICGGSIAGLVTARVCSSHFTKVLIIEPEEWVTTKDGLKYVYHDKEEKNLPPPKRSHIAQYNALHGYHALTTLVFGRLFPDSKREFEREGVCIGPMEVKTALSGVPVLQPYDRYPNGVLPNVIFAKRAVFETTLRRLVLENCPNVTYHHGSVIGLLQSESRSNQLVGVKVRSREGDEKHISACLVVDCTGPACGGLRWLKDLSPISDSPSTQSPSTSTSLSLQELKMTYDHKMAYTTCEYLVPYTLNESLDKLSFPNGYEKASHLYVYYPNSEVERSHVIIARRENNTIQFACGGWGVHARITSIAELRSFLSQQMVPKQPLPTWLFPMLDLFEQEHVPANYYYSRCPPAVLVQYHRAKNLPQNFIAIGDSVQQSNPLAGQGVTKAFVEAVTLNTMLARCVDTCSTRSEDILPSDFGSRFFGAQAKRTGHVWESLKTADYSFNTTIPAAGDDLKTTNAWRRWYTTGVMRLSTKDLYVAGVLYQTTNWLAPFTALFSPVIIQKVLWLKFTEYMGV